MLRFRMLFGEVFYISKSSGKDCVAAMGPYIFRCVASCYAFFILALLPKTISNADGLKRESEWL